MSDALYVVKPSTVEGHSPKDEVGNILGLAWKSNAVLLVTRLVYSVPWRYLNGRRVGNLNQQND